MPIGCYATVPLLAHHLGVHQPRRVLDLGMGAGGNACIVRQWLDLGIRPWKTYLVGVEVWAAYRNPMWDLYNLVVVDTINNYLNWQSESFDCVLLTDVIEHFNKDEGRQLLNDVRRVVNVGGTLVVGTPAEFFAQGAAHGNHYEQHRSFWSRQDFEELGFCVDKVGRTDFTCGQSWFAIWRRSEKHPPGGESSP